MLHAHLFVAKGNCLLRLRDRGERNTIILYFARNRVFIHYSCNDIFLTFSPRLLWINSIDININDNNTLGTFFVLGTYYVQCTHQRAYT